jgi:hypothetical protein
MQMAKMTVTTPRVSNTPSSNTASRVVEKAKTVSARRMTNASKTPP